MEACRGQTGIIGGPTPAVTSVQADLRSWGPAPSHPQDWAIVVLLSSQQRTLSLFLLPVARREHAVLCPAAKAQCRGQILKKYCAAPLVQYRGKLGCPTAFGGFGRFTSFETNIA